MAMSGAENDIGIVKDWLPVDWSSLTGSLLECTDILTATSYHIPNQGSLLLWISHWDTGKVTSRPQ